MKKITISSFFVFLITWVVGCSPLVNRIWSSSSIIEASRTGDMGLVNSLVASGTDVNVTDSGGGTALYWATYKGHASIVRYLLAAGADPNIKTRYNSAPLELAASRGDRQA